MIKVLLVDDHEMVRLKSLLIYQIQDDIEVIGKRKWSSRVWKGIGITSRCDFDGFGDGWNGWDRIYEIDFNDWPEAKIIIVTSFIDDEKSILLLKRVRHSYLLKDVYAHEIAKSHSCNPARAGS